jgi:hypothetical protein
MIRQANFFVDFVRRPLWSPQHNNKDSSDYPITPMTHLMRWLMEGRTAGEYQIVPACYGDIAVDSVVANSGFVGLQAIVARGGKIIGQL